MDEVIWRVDTREAEAFFEYAGYHARNLRDPLTEAGNALLSHINRTFETEGEEIGEPWAQLSRSQVRWREAHGFPGDHPILRVTGDLIRHAINRRTLHVHDNELEYELDHPYAAAHQYGGWWDEGGVNHKGDYVPPSQHPPQRKFVEVTPEFEAEVVDHFRLWLDRLHAVAGTRAKRFRGIANPLA